MNPVASYRQERGLSLEGMSRITGAMLCEIAEWEQGIEPVPQWVKVLLEAKRRVNMQCARR